MPSQNPHGFADHSIRYCKYWLYYTSFSSAKQGDQYFNHIAVPEKNGRFDYCPMSRKSSNHAPQSKNSKPVCTILFLLHYPTHHKCACIQILLLGKCFYLGAAIIRPVLLPIFLFFVKLPRKIQQPVDCQHLSFLFRWQSRTGFAVVGSMTFAGKFLI